MQGDGGVAMLEIFRNDWHFHTMVAVKCGEGDASSFQVFLLRCHLATLQPSALRLRLVVLSPLAAEWMHGVTPHWCIVQGAAKEWAMRSGSEETRALTGDLPWSRFGMS